MRVSPPLEPLDAANRGLRAVSVVTVKHCANAAPLNTEKCLRHMLHALCVLGGDKQA